jgi:pilus assembly protein CpaE
MAIFLLRESGAEGTIEADLRATIPGLVEVASFNRILERKSAADRDQPATVLVVAQPGDHGYFDQLVEVAAQHHNEIFLILISDEISASDYKRLVRTGGAEWASAKAGSREVVEIITRRGQQERAYDKRSLISRNLLPVTVAFIPSAGGVGNTTLIIESAIYLQTNKATQTRKICIIDLDFQTSHVCDYLDSQARLQIAEFSNAPDRLDEHLLDSFKTSHSSGIDIFAAPRSKFPSEELNIDALDALFSMIAKRYDLVFIDFPGTCFSWTAQVIAACDGAVITGLNTIPNLRQVLETSTFVRMTAATLKIGIALNRCEKNLLGSIAGRKHVERLLPDEELFFVSNRAEAIESVNMGVPMILGPSARKLREEFSGLAAFCAELKSARTVSL